MIQECWLNLPVEDVQKSKSFFQSLGFSFQEDQSQGPHSAVMLVGTKPVVVMLFQQEIFKNFIGGEISNPQIGNEMLISIDAPNRETVVAQAQKAQALGGTVFGEPSEIDGWMFGCGFTDLDGHKWNVLYMDQEKRPF
ncbi:MAG: VOC family protein [Bacteroidia bacterium]|jgi:predicted lactoylglutathione lyase